MPLQISLIMIVIAVAIGGLLAGFFAGVAASWWLMVQSAGDYDAGVELHDLLDILVANGVPGETATRAAELGANKWARYRWRTRPILWRLGREWPEFYPVGREEFLAHYGKGLPELEAEYEVEQSSDGIPEWLLSESEEDTEPEESDDLQTQSDVTEEP